MATIEQVLTSRVEYDIENISRLSTEGDLDRYLKAIQPGNVILLKAVLGDDILSAWHKLRSTGVEDR